MKLERLLSQYSACMNVRGPEFGSPESTYTWSLGMAVYVCNFSVLVSGGGIVRQVDS